MAAIAAISCELDKLSNKEVKEALTMVSSVRNLRIISMDRPIGLPIQSAPPKVRSPGSQKEVSRKATPKATWKSDPRWVDVDRRHSELVSQIKTEPDAIAKGTAITSLRELEGEMKILKHQLQGFHEAG
jgi:hypothetical protein